MKSFEQIAQAMYEAYETKHDLGCTNFANS